MGLLQGLGPALRGEANPAVSPRAAEVRYDSHHAFALIAGSVLASVAIAFSALTLLFLLLGAVRVSPTAAPARSQDRSISSAVSLSPS